MLTSLLPKKTSAGTALWRRPCLHLGICLEDAGLLSVMTLTERQPAKYLYAVTRLMPTSRDAAAIETPCVSTKALSFSTFSRLTG